jgi:NAD(P)-dependent dehydrogenase (short-subunit alcohol dehydrogenase family)
MDKIALITGGSRGIGAATVRLAAKRDFAVCFSYRADDKAAAQVVAEVEATGGKAVAMKADVCDETAVAELFEHCQSELGTPTALVNNAGLLERQMRLDEMELARWQRVFAANVFGSFLCAKQAVRLMSTRHGGAGGAIVNLSSAAAYLGSPNEFIDYAASKGAIDAMTIGLAKEVASEGIRVNAVRPGLIETEIHLDSGEPGRVERLAPHVPMQRGGTAEEVAQAILWLLSDEASYVTGTFIDVTGGR